MATTTPNLGLTKPDDGGDDDAWAPMLNGNADILDTQVKAALDNAAAANTNANSRLLASLVTAAALTVLDDATVAAMRGTLGSTTVGDAVFIAANAAAARSAIGAPAVGIAGAGAGQVTALGSTSGGACTLPASGTWSFWIQGVTDSTLAWSGIRNCGVNAGGTQVGAGVAGNTYVGWCRRET